MPRNTIREVNEAVGRLYATFASDKTRPEGKRSVGLMTKFYKELRTLYQPDVSLTVTDTNSATLDHFVNDAESQLVVALKAQPRVGQIFRVNGNGDTTDNALAAAKAAGIGFELHIVITDEEDATAAILLAAGGEIHDAIGRVLVPGERFRVNATGDTTDNALAAAKGGAVAANDVFQVNAAGTGVVYVGNTAAVAAGDLFEVTSVTEDSETVKYLGSVNELSLGSYELEDF